MLARRIVLAGIPAALATLLALAPAAEALQSGDHIDTDAYLRMVTGVRYLDDPRGTGPEPRKGQSVTVTYTGWVFDGDKVGKRFDSSADHGGSFAFVLGAGQVIPGWDQGVSTMRVGGTRTMILPSRLAYGEHGAGDAIPPDATLIFVVRLLAVQ